VSILESTNVIEVITTVASVSRPRLGRVVKLQRLPAKVDLSQVSCSLVDLLSTRLQLTRSRQLWGSCSWSLEVDHQSLTRSRLHPLLPTSVLFEGPMAWNIH
jgi:hypothetical protein